MRNIFKRHRPRKFDTIDARLIQELAAHPLLRTLVGRMARSEAKSAVQEVLEVQGIAFNADGSVHLLTEDQAAADAFNRRLAQHLAQRDQEKGII